MKFFNNIFFLSCCFSLVALQLRSQSSSPAPYCNGGYTSGTCLQGGPTNTPGNSVNDFIDNFITTGASSNITHTNSGCNGNPLNYANYCTHFLQVSPGQTIVCSIQSGIIYSQGFAIFIDWNQDNTFAVPAERVAATTNVPAAATWTTMSFVVPPLQANGTYRMRVRCAWATPGTAITPCGTFGFGETEDYSIFIGPIPPLSGVVTATLGGNSPLCAGQNLSLTATSNYTSGITYTWTGPNNYTAVAQNPVITAVTTSASGIYTVITNGSCPASKTYTVNVINYPVYTVTPNNPSICQGGSINAVVNFSPGTNAALYSFTWAPSPGFGIFNVNQQQTFIAPPFISSTQSIVIYTVTVSRSTLSCPLSQTMALTINNPLTPTLNIPPPLCNTNNPFLLTATPGGGTWSANQAVTAGGSFSPGVAINGTSTIVYAVSVANCVVSNLDTISVAQFNTPALSSNPGTLCVQDAGVNLMAIVQTTLTGVWTGPAVVGNVFYPTGLPTGIYPLTYSTQSTPVPQFAGVCPSSTLLNVSVFNPPTPVITPINPKCSNAPSVVLTASPPGGIWLGSGISSTGVQTPSQNVVGVNTLTYTVGQGTCVASNTANFFVAQFNTAVLSGTVPNMCVSHNPFNLMSIVQNSVNGSWSGVNVTGTYSFNPAGLPSNTYTLTYRNFPTPISYSTLCSHSTAIVVSVLNPTTPVIAQVGPFCNTSPPIQLSVSPNTGYWSSNTYLSSTGVLSPALCGPGNNLVQYVIGTATCNTQSNVYIGIESFVPATIVSSIPDQCNSNSSVNLLPLTANNSGVWSGPGVSGANFSPNTTGAGVFVLSYSTASSPSGLCPDHSTLAVRVFSLAAPQIVKVGPFCNSAPPMQLQANPTGGIFGGPVMSAINAQGNFLPASANVGDNVISYSISSGPCIAYAQTTITIERFVSADFDSPAGPFCRDASPVNMNSFVKNSGGMWTGPGMQGNMFYPNLANVGNNNFITYRTFSIPTATLCEDTSAVRIRVNQIPVVTVATNTNQGCAPLEVILNTPSSNTGHGFWKFGDGSPVQEGLNISHIYNEVGTYTVLFSYSDEIGCETQTELATQISVYDLPTADFSAPQQVMISNPTAQLTNLSNVLGDNTYTWRIADLYETHDVNPIVTFTKIGLYHITLQATTINGCKHAVSKTIEVKNDFNVFIPNSFTPNFDGLNDVFMPVFTPYGLDTKTYEMEIFDRWGHSLFYTKDPSKGWDGLSPTRSTEALQEGVYVYKIKFKDMDGNLYNQTGYVTLIN